MELKTRESGESSELKKSWLRAMFWRRKLPLKRSTDSFYFSIPFTNFPNVFIIIFSMIPFIIK
jgi:hypothetical protein